MKTVNVRCCCQPEKIIGTLDLSEGTIERRRFWVFERPWPKRFVTADASLGLDEIQPFNSDRYLIVLKNFSHADNAGDRREVAVYSDDRPIEFWRKLHSFKEAVC